MRQTLRSADDRGVAAVVGFVLILAAGVTYYSWAAQNDVPRVGAENEHDWDAAVSEALTRLAHTAGDRVGTDAVVREVLPPAPDAPTQSMPFLAPLRSARASGSLAYASECGGASLAHTTASGVVVDLQNGAKGCITFRGDTAYAESFTYRIELGGVLRTQGDKAAVLAGPPLDVTAGHVTLTMLELRGAPQTLGIDRANAPITLSPRPSALELGAVTNALTTSWTFTTDYPEAWRDWYDDRFDAAGVTAAMSIACADPLAAGPARGPCTLDIDLPGATSLSISYGRYEVGLG